MKPVPTVEALLRPCAAAHHRSFEAIEGVQGSGFVGQSAEGECGEIAGDGSYRLGSEVVDQSSLRDRLVSMFERRGERVRFVKAVAGVEFAVVAAAIDTAHGANIDRVALMPR